MALAAPSLPGFTIIEVIVVLAIMAVFAAAAPPLTHGFRIGYQGDNAVASYVSALHRAQVLAQTGAVDAPWGVAIATGTVTIYKGATYAARDTNYDEVYAIGRELSPGGVTAVTFAKLSGTPGTTGTTTIAVPGLATVSVNINSKGMISY